MQVLPKFKKGTLVRAVNDQMVVMIERVTLNGGAYWYTCNNGMVYAEHELIAYP